MAGAGEAAAGAAGVVCTCRRPPCLGSWVAAHLRSGWQRVWIYLDAPSEDAAAAAAVAAQWSAGRVEVIEAGEGSAVRREWEALVGWRMWGPHVGSEVMARQCLNAEHCLTVLAPRAPVRWLAHLDCDEVLLRCADPGDISPVFSALSACGAQRATFANHEVLPEQVEYADPLCEATLFQLSPAALELRPGARIPQRTREGLRRLRRRASGHEEAAGRFLAYSNGKGAGWGWRPPRQRARVRGRGLPR
eukprot:TRINITY_DN9957_c0_g1_i1.p2 TRINITY_DN9957_c0_g1~~TRINITY_DN9957_c0_g1_i1.p2  ORF type:complete len:265 (+),score=57.49 TRINITY_DN9957_c0_g1_i1:52-795(+)